MNQDKNIRRDESSSNPATTAIKIRLEHEQMTHECLKINRSKNRHKNKNDISHIKRNARIDISNRNCLFTLSHQGDRMRVQ